MRAVRAVVTAIAFWSFAGVVSAQTTNVAALTCSPSRLLPGGTATCTVTLSIPAPEGGTVVSVTSTSQSLIPSSISLAIPAGAAAATFMATAGAFLSDETAAVTATALHSVFLSWAASVSPSPTHYNLYRGTTPGGPYPAVTAVDLATAYKDSNVQAGQTYYYVLTAVDAAGAEIGYSNEASATLPGAVPQTTALSLCASLRTGITGPSRCGALPPGAGRPRSTAIR